MTNENNIPKIALGENSEAVEKRINEMMAELRAEAENGKDECYDFTWVGKRKAKLAFAEPISKVLRPQIEESVNWDTTENLFIEGDNLDALKLLQESYLGKVKMIYIDPPYNTGKDFVYHDNFKISAEDWDEQTEYKDKDGNIQFRKNEKSNGRYHSDWLTMMYPRLKLARNLLSDDGVIFISIDDNEQANLKKLCDEVFGEENFLNVFPRVTKKGGKSSDVTAKNHDYVLMYAKNNTNADLVGISHNDRGYCNQDEHFEIRGYYKANQTLDYDSLGYVKTLDYPIEFNGDVFYAGGDIKMYNNRQQGQHGRADWGWRWSKELFEFGLANGFIEIHRGGARPRIYTKTYQKVKIEQINNDYKIVDFDRTKPLSTLEFTENKYSNDNAKKVYDDIMQKGVFEYTKTPELIKQLARLIYGYDYIILDFFAGSGTTAHAVMQLNAEDGGNRKFILVQLDEKTDEKSDAYKAGYKTIPEISRERIRRAGERLNHDFHKIKQDSQDLFAANNQGNPENLTEIKVQDKLDIGFRALKIDDDNFKSVRRPLGEIEQGSLAFDVDNIKKERTPLDLLFGCLTAMALELNKSVEIRTVAGTEVLLYDYSCAGSGVIACFADSVPEEVVKEIAKLKPLSALFKDSSFATSAEKVNLYEHFRLLSPETKVRVI